MNLTEWAKTQGVHPQTAYRWFRDGTLPVPAQRVGPRTILVNINANTTPLSAAGRRLLVLDDGEAEDDPVRDMMEAMTSFCARLYGRRSARNRARKALEAAKHG
ncbi:hypothetical protein ACWD64_17320 [Streptomyces antibioticus]